MWCKCLMFDVCITEWSVVYIYCRKSYPDGEGANPAEEVHTPIIDVDDEDYQMTLPSGAKIGHRYTDYRIHIYLSF